MFWDQWLLQRLQPGLRVLSRSRDRREVEWINAINRNSLTGPWGVQVQNLRIFKSYSRGEAARRSSVTSKHFEAVEEGIVRPEPALLLEIANLYEVLPSRIFTVAGTTLPTGS